MKKKLTKDDEIKELQKVYAEAIRKYEELFNEHKRLNYQYKKLESYVKHIQEYLLKDILELMNGD